MKKVIPEPVWKSRRGRLAEAVHRAVCGLAGDAPQERKCLYYAGVGSLALMLLTGSDDWCIAAGSIARRPNAEDPAWGYAMVSENGEGVVRASRVGGRTMIDLPALDAYLEAAAVATLAKV